MKILIFTWNAEGLFICQAGVTKKVTASASCTSPSFLGGLQGEIATIKPDVVVFHTQGEVRNESHFHGAGGVTETIMGTTGEYFRLSEGYGTGFGFLRLMTAEGSRMSKKFSLHTTVYVSAPYQQTTLETSWIKRLMSSDEVHSPFDPVQGALATTFTVPGKGRYLFLNVNLTQQPKTPVLDFQGQQTICYATLALMNIFERLFFTKEENDRPNYIFLSGDFGLPLLRVPDKGDMMSMLASDPMKMIIANPFFMSFQEGVNNEGPKFPPTGMLKINRDTGCQATPSLSCYSAITWSERSLYFTRGNSIPISCIKYDRFDIQSMSKSTNAGIISVFEV